MVTGLFKLVPQPSLQLYLSLYCKWIFLQYAEHERCVQLLSHETLCCSDEYFEISHLFPSQRGFNW